MTPESQSVRTPLEDVSREIRRRSYLCFAVFFGSPAIAGLLIVLMYMVSNLPHPEATTVRIDRVLEFWQQAEPQRTGIRESLLLYSTILVTAMNFPGLVRPTRMEESFEAIAQQVFFQRLTAGASGLLAIGPWLLLPYPVLPNQAGGVVACVLASGLGSALLMGVNVSSFDRYRIRTASGKRIDRIEDELHSIGFVEGSTNSWVRRASVRPGMLAVLALAMPLVPFAVLVPVDQRGTAAIAGLIIALLILVVVQLLTSAVLRYRRLDRIGEGRAGLAALVLVLVACSTILVLYAGALAFLSVGPVGSIMVPLLAVASTLGHAFLFEPLYPDHVALQDHVAYERLKEESLRSVRIQDEFLEAGLDGFPHRVRG